MRLPGGGGQLQRCQSAGAHVKEVRTTMVRTPPIMIRRLLYFAPLTIAASLCAATAASAGQSPIKLEVDATDATRKVLHARLQIPVQPGPVTLVYPKWIPGDHSPTGPIADLVGLKMSAGGQPVQWRR